jgi:hypothetical protein
VVMLASFTEQPYHTLDNYNVVDFMKRIKDAQTMSGYIVNKSILNVLIDNVQDAITKADPCDIHWKVLQETYNWYVFTPKLGCQMESFSDIEKRDVSYLDKYDTMSTVPTSYDYLIIIRTNNSSNNTRVAKRVQHLMQMYNNIYFFYCKGDIEYMTTLNTTNHTAVDYEIDISNRMIYVNCDDEYNANCIHKTSHAIKAISDLCKQSGKFVSLNNILLIDDDMKYIIAIEKHLQHLYPNDIDVLIKRNK